MPFGFFFSLLSNFVLSYNIFIIYSHFDLEMRMCPVYHAGRLWHFYNYSS